MGGAVEEEVVAAAADELVVAGAAVEGVVLGGTGEVIVARFAEEDSLPGLAGGGVHGDVIIALAGEDGDGFAVEIIDDLCLPADLEDGLVGRALATLLLAALAIGMTNAAVFAASAALSKAQKEADAKGYIFVAAHEEIVSKAKQEGKVRVIVSTDGGLLKHLTAGFKKKYPFIDIRADELRGTDAYIRQLHTAPSRTVPRRGALPSRSQHAARRRRKSGRDPLERWQGTSPR